MATWVNLMDIVYPIGAFYISHVNTSPSSLIGGTWAQVTNAVIRGVSSSTKSDYTGSDSTTLTTSQIPSHSHNWRSYWSEAGWDGTSPIGYLTINPNPSGWGGLLKVTKKPSDKKYQLIKNPGGGGRTPTFSGLTTAMFGSGLPNLWKVGDVAWLQH